MASRVPPLKILRVFWPATLTAQLLAAHEQAGAANRPHLLYGFVIRAKESALSEFYSIVVVGAAPAADDAAARELRVQLARLQPAAPCSQWIMTLTVVGTWTATAPAGSAAQPPQLQIQIPARAQQHQQQEQPEVLQFAGVQRVQTRGVRARQLLLPQLLPCAHVAPPGASPQVSE